MRPKVATRARPDVISPRRLTGKNLQRKRLTHERTLLREEMDAVSAALRASQVYATAARVFFNIKKTQWRETSLKKRLGLELSVSDVTHPELDDLWDATHERNAKMISSCIVDLKGLWIKVGQFLSSRPDIMPLPYIRHFRKLQADPAILQEARTVQSRMHCPLGRGKKLIRQAPLSSASIAQVHRATLKTGEEVVIKARHRNVDKLMHNDLQNLETLCNWIAWINEDYDFRKIVKEWIPAVKDELDLRNEAENLDTVRRNMERAEIKVIIPRIPNPDLVKADVLVMEYCKGFSVREVDAYSHHGVDKMTLLDRICNAWAVQMHVDGVFNADPHPGNILVSTDPQQNGGDASVPVLLDFGLTRKFDVSIKLAFSRLVHSCYVMDVDGLLRAFDEMGLKIREQDPFQDIVNLRRAFETVPASEAKSEREKRQKEYAIKQKASPRTKRPVDAWPGELVFFTRVIGLLKGLCSLMEVRYPYLQITAMAALETLRNAFSSEERATDLIFAETLAGQSKLQRQVSQAVLDAKSRDAVLGMQVAIIHKGKFVADVTAGTLGIADPRPVRPDTLFSVFSVTKAITAALLHIAIQQTEASYDDLVSDYWPGFERNGKERCTLRHVLNHQAGLAGALPDIATVDEILDWKQMLPFLQESRPTHAPGEREEYHYLTFGYLVGGILKGMTRKSFEELVSEWIAEPLNLKGEIFVGLPPDVPDDRLAVLQHGYSAALSDGMLASFGAESRWTGGQQPRWEKFKGSEHLANPTTFNMRQVREACIPSANGHMSARALAKFYSALTKTAAVPLMDTSFLVNIDETSQVERSARYDGYLASAAGLYTLGFCRYTFTRKSDGGVVYGFGHPGLGGSFGMVIPEEDLAFGLTQSYLTQDKTTLGAILQHVCDLLDLNPDQSIA